MQNFSRRSFLRLSAAAGVAAAAASALPVYAESREIIVPISPNPSKWVEDRGGYNIIRVPRGQKLRDEEFAKPAIILLGAGAEILRCSFPLLNLYAPDTGYVEDLMVDTTKLQMTTDRPAMRVGGRSLLFFQNMGFKPSDKVSTLLCAEEHSVVQFDQDIKVMARHELAPT